MAMAISVRKEAGGVAVLTLAKEPVNTMDLGFWQELLVAFEALEADAEVRAVIFQSGLKKNVFTAGLDIKELYAPNTSKERLTEFWATLSKVLTKVYATPMVTAAAIKGACPAGGCCLALCCDYRVITKDGSMGLNEVQLGICVPDYWVELFAACAGQRQAELLLQRGDIVPSERLLELSMVDAIVDGAEQVLPAALAEVARWLKSPDSGRIETKELLRGPLAERWLKGGEKEAAHVWRTVSSPGAVATLGKVLDKLSGGKKPMSKL